MSFYIFDCGCKVPILNNSIKPEDGLPSMKIDFLNINHNCPLCWDVYSSGRTKGLFQLEKSLGQSWSKKVKPTSGEEVSALIALIRPGTLKSIVDNKSMAQHYVDRKEGEDYELFHPEASEILDKTYGVILYQEQTLAIAKKFAGFSLVEADSLRKAIGKKNPELMAKMRSVFIDGCAKTGLIDNEDAGILFDIIEKSNRYSFNKSHSTTYAEIGYWCAWTKAHFPLHFFCSWLTFASEKMKPRDEISELIIDAKGFNIDVLGPSLFEGNEYFTIKNGKIRYGLRYIKDIGESSFKSSMEKIEAAEIKLGKRIRDMSWLELLLNVLPNLKKTVVTNLIAVGALSNFGKSRQEMAFEYRNILELKPTEIDFLSKRQLKSLESGLSLLATSGVLRKGRSEKILDIIKVIENPPVNLTDTSDYIANAEENLMGIAITCSKLDTRGTSGIDSTVETVRTQERRSYCLKLQISDVREWSPKGSKDKLAFITAYDNSGKLDIMVPSNLYKDVDFLIFKGNTVCLTGFKNDKGNFQARKITQI